MTPLIIICIYMTLLLFLGFFASRLFSGTKNDYLLASHSIGPFLLLMSLFGTTMTAFALVGSTGEAFKEGIGVYGLLASSSGIIHSLCFFVIGIKLWSLGRKYGYTTQIQFFRDRLDSNLIGRWARARRPAAFRTRSPAEEGRPTSSTTRSESQ